MPSAATDQVHSTARRQAVKMHGRAVYGPVAKGARQVPANGARIPGRTASAMAATPEFFYPAFDLLKAVPDYPEERSASRLEFVCVVTLAWSNSDNATAGTSQYLTKMDNQKVVLIQRKSLLNLLTFTMLPVCGTLKCAVGRAPGCFRLQKFSHGPMIGFHSLAENHI